MSPYEMIERQMREYAELMPEVSRDAVRIYGRRVALACGIEPVWLDWTHGRIDMYEKHGCRCAECRACICIVKRRSVQRRRFKRELQARGFVVQAA